MLITGNQGLVKQLNKWLVLNTVRQAEAISRAEVARRTGLNAATVWHLTAELLDEGLIQEVGHGDSRGGRRPVLLRVNPDGLYAVGVEVSAAAVRVLVLDLAARVVGRREWPLLPGAQPEGTAAAIAEGIKEVLKAAEVDGARTVGVGVALPGVMDHRRGLLLHWANLPGWQDVPIQQLLADRLGMPVAVERDAIAAAVGEMWHGAGRGCQDLVFLLVDMGVGAGVVAGGQVQRGAHGGAGEVGHLTVDIGGPRCACGNYGCLEAMASGWALRRRMAAALRLDPGGGEAGEQEPELAAILAAAEAGDPVALPLVEEAGRYLGLGLANVINAYDPELVVLGGTIPLASPRIREVMLATARARALPILTGKVRVVLPHFGPDACAAGAATLALERFFAPVRVVSGR